MGDFFLFWLVKPIAEALGTIALIAAFLLIVWIAAR